MHTPIHRSGQISEFHIFAPPNAATAKCRPGACLPSSPSYRHWTERQVDAAKSTVQMCEPVLSILVPKGGIHMGVPGP